MEGRYPSVALSGAQRRVTLQWLQSTSSCSPYLTHLPPFPLLLTQIVEQGSGSIIYPLSRTRRVYDRPAVCLPASLRR